MPEPESKAMDRCPDGQVAGNYLFLDSKGRNQQWGEYRCEYDVMNNAYCEQSGPERAKWTNVQKKKDGPKCVCRRSPQTLAFPIRDPGQDQQKRQQFGREIPMGRPTTGIGSLSAIG